MEIVTQETGEVKKVTYRELKVAMDSEMGKNCRELCEDWISLQDGEGYGCSSGIWIFILS